MQFMQVILLNSGEFVLACLPVIIIVLFW